MKPLILHLETSGKNCSVAVSKGAELLCLCEELSEQFSHSKKLHRFIEWALEGAELSLSDLNAVSVSRGPGSYTGLRIGVSAAKGLAFGLNIPLLSSQSLRTLAIPYIDGNFENYLSTLDARRNELFYQVFQNLESPTSPLNAEINDELLQAYFNQKNLIIGNGAIKVKDYLDENHPEQVPNFQFILEEKISAQYAIKEVLHKFERQDFEDTAYFEPEYVKSVHITQSKKN